MYTQHCNHSNSPRDTLALWLCGLVIPFLVACGMPPKRSSALDSQSIYYDNYQDPNVTPPGRPPSSERANMAVDVPLPKKGCDGFTSRPAKNAAHGDILAVKEEASGGQVKVTPLRWDKRGSLSVARAKTFHYHLNSESLEPVQLTLDGNDLYATYQQKDGQYSLERHPLFSNDTSMVKFAIKDMQPRTLKAYEGYAYFSDKINVHVVDLYQSHTPSCQLRSPFVDIPLRGLEVDGLTRDGRTLIAVNDHELAKYVFIFHIDDKGLGQPRYGAQLTYRDDLRYREFTAQQNLLAVYGTYIKEGRTGHLLTTFNIQSRILTPLGEHEIPPPPPHVEGDPIMAWRGLAIIHNHVIISSSRGGIQVFDDHLRLDTRKEFKPDGYITDLIVRGNNTYALAQTKSGSAVIALRWNNAKKTLDIVSTHKIPGTPNQFVR